MKTIIISLFLALAVESHAMIFFGGATTYNADHADNVDNSAGTNVWLFGTCNGWLGVSLEQRHINPWTYDQSIVVIGNSYYASGAPMTGTTPNGAYSMLLAPDGFSLSQASVDGRIAAVLSDGPEIDASNAHDVQASAIVGTIPDSALPVFDTRRVLETVIYLDRCYPGGGEFNVSPFMSGGFLNRFNAGENNLFMPNFSRLAPAALALGLTNLVCETWMISTGAVSGMTAKVQMFLLTNSPTGPGGSWAVIPDVAVNFAPGKAATNWFRFATTSAIPAVAWANLAGVSRWSIYNPTTTNCWHSGAKFYLQ